MNNTKNTTALNILLIHNSRKQRECSNFYKENLYTYSCFMCIFITSFSFLFKQTEISLFLSCSLNASFSYDLMLLCASSNFLHHPCLFVLWECDIYRSIRNFSFFPFFSLPLSHYLFLTLTLTTFGGCNIHKYSENIYIFVQNTFEFMNTTWCSCTTRQNICIAMEQFSFSFFDDDTQPQQQKHWTKYKQQQQHKKRKIIFLCGKPWIAQIYTHALVLFQMKYLNVVWNWWSQRAVELCC